MQTLGCGIIVFGWLLVSLGLFAALIGVMIAGRFIGL